MTLSFSPTKDPSYQAHQSHETTAALLNHRRLFFQGGLALMVTASISLPPDVFFNLVLLTLSCYSQLHIPPTSTGTYNGATDYLPHILTDTPDYNMACFRPAPWLAPSLSDPNTPLDWHCLDRNYTLTNNDNLSFCSGSIIRGVIKPYFLSNPWDVRANNSDGQPTSRKNTSTPGSRRA